MAKRKMHPNSLNNLKPAKKGEVRNPKGKPPGTLSLKKLLEEKLQETTPIERTVAVNYQPQEGETKTINKDGDTVVISNILKAHMVVDRLIERAMYGDLRAIDLILTHLEGRPGPAKEDPPGDDTPDYHIKVKGSRSKLLKNYIDAKPVAKKTKKAKK